MNNPIQTTQPWLIELAYLNSRFISPQATSEIQAFVSKAPVDEDTQSRRDRAKSYIKTFYSIRQDMQIEEGVAKIHVFGPLLQGADFIQTLLGATDYGDILDDLEKAQADETVKAILLDVSSPGGMALGAPEVAEAIRTSEKPVVAYTGDIMASAAYYISAGASAIVASPSAVVGSIGTLAQILDITGLYESMGVKIHTFTPAESDLKTTGHPTVPMTDAQKEHMKESVSKINADFTGFVTSNRPGVTAAEMRGQTFRGKEAQNNGLADATGSIKDAVELAKALAGVDAE